MDTLLYIRASMCGRAKGSIKNERMPVGNRVASSLGDIKAIGDFHKLPVGLMTPYHYIHTINNHTISIFVGYIIFNLLRTG